MRSFTILAIAAVSICLTGTSVHGKALQSKARSLKEILNISGLDARGCNFPVCAGAFYVATTECIGSIEDPPVFLACMAADAAFSGSCCGCMVTQDITPTTTPFQDDCNAVACAGAMGTSYLACAGIEDPLDWVPCIVGFAGVKGFCGPCCCNK